MAKEIKTTNENLKVNLNTTNEVTWCPGCPNFLILAAVKNAIGKLISEKYAKQEEFAITTDIGCNSKIFDYINLSGVYGLHGRSLATGIGVKLGNPNLKVISFAGDGGMYSEGMEHFIHAGRFNADMTLIVHDNQSFSLTTGQATPTTQQGYKNKAEPMGEFNRPLNPVKLALASGTTFIARCDAKDIVHTAETIQKAIKHKGFSYVEIIQDCLIFNTDMNKRNEFVYKIQDNNDKTKAEKLASEWDYNSKKGKIPIGVLYKEETRTLDEEWPQLQKLLDKKVSWKGLKR